MPWDLYWHGDPQAVRLYRESDRLSVERRDREMWVQGNYVYDAMICAAPLYMTFHKTHRPHGYDELPYSERTAEKERERQDAAQRQNARDAAMDIARWAGGVIDAQKEEAGRDG